MLILLDQDGVLADFDAGFHAAWQQHYPHTVIRPREHRRSFYLLEDLPPHLREQAEALYTSPGFISNLPPVPGALEAWQALESMGFTLRICSTPLQQYENCVAEKYQWVEKHLGRAATRQLVLTADKTLVAADLLIDDKPEITGARAPTWEHVLFDAPYNQTVVGKKRINWQNWRGVLAGVMYVGEY